MAVINVDYEITEPEPRQEQPVPAPPQSIPAPAPVVPSAPVAAPAPAKEPNAPLPEPAPAIVPLAPSSPPEPEDPADPEIAARLSMDRPAYKTRIDSARNRTPRSQSHETPDDLGDLLEEAVSLLESVAGLPAVKDYSALKQRLDNVEQLLNASANVR